MKGILIDIEEAVATPGAKMLPIGSRVEDAIKADGGLMKNADMEYVSRVINRAQTLSDEMKIYVPNYQGSETSYNNDTQINISKTSYNISSDINNPDG